MLRHIPLGKMHNLRDLGGYPVPGGGETAWERLLRGDNPEGLTAADIQWLLDRDITTVVDLRSLQEAERKPDQLSSVSAFCYVNCPLMGEAVMPDLGDEAGKGYFHILEGRERVAQALTQVASAPGGVLFHCTAGKDRTGLVAALLLGLAGVGRADLLADYQVSETYLADIIRRIREKVPELAPFAGASRSAYLAECLDLLEAKYGSISGYLRAAALSDEAVGALRQKLLGESGGKGGPAVG